MKNKFAFFVICTILLVFLSACQRKEEAPAYNYISKTNIQLFFDGSKYVIYGEGEEYDFIVESVAGKSGTVIKNIEDAVYFLLPDEESGFISGDAKFPYEEDRKNGNEAIYGFFPSLNLFGEQLALRSGGAVQNFNGILFDPKESR